jgi:biotin operon repressor
LKLTQTSRIDFPVGNIIDGILQNLYIIKTWNGGEINDKKFIDRMETIRFLLQNTIFSKYYPEYKNVFSIKRDITTETISPSQHYLQKLGFPYPVILNFRKLIKTLTIQEEKVLRLLTASKTTIVSFDTIAQEIWGSDHLSRFSLEAIAKLIQNLREKIRQSGINKNIIFTVRKKGYFLGL